MVEDASNGQHDGAGGDGEVTDDPRLAAEAGVAEPVRADGFHALRHFYASVLLDAGENIRAVAEYLGHADPAFTLRVYTHLMPSSAARTRLAIDRIFGGDIGT
jgi:integrase